MLALKGLRTTTRVLQLRADVERYVHFAGGFGATSQAGGGLFGATNTGGTGLFGGTAAASNTGTGLFGAGTCKSHTCSVKMFV